MQFKVLLSLRVAQPTWRPESSYMTCCSSTLDVQTAEKVHFVHFAFHVAIKLYYIRTKNAAIMAK